MLPLQVGGIDAWAAVHAPAYALSPVFEAGHGPVISVPGIIPASSRQRSCITVAQREAPSGCGQRALRVARVYGIMNTASSQRHSKDLLATPGVVIISHSSRSKVDPVVGRGCWKLPKD